MTPPNTLGGGVDPLAVVGRAPEDRNWKPGDAAYEPLIHPGARVEALATIDAGTKTPTRVDEGAWIFKHAHVGHDAWIQPGAEIGTGSVVGGHAVVECDARVGIGVTILPYRKVGHRAHVGAGAVVVKDVPPYATVVGNPARILRDEERHPRPHSARATARPDRPVADRTPATPPCRCGRAHPLQRGSMPPEPPDNAIAKILPDPGDRRMPDSVVNYENGGPSPYPLDDGERRSLGLRPRRWPWRNGGRLT